MTVYSPYNRSDSLLAINEQVLVVEDDMALRELLEEELREQNFQVRAVRTAEEALDIVDAWIPQLIISDIRLPGMSGIDFLGEIQKRVTTIAPAFIIITAFGSIDDAVICLKNGADDFLTKPLDLDHLQLRVRRLLDVYQLKEEVRRYRSREAPDSFHGMVGRSTVMRQIFDEITTISQGQGPVSIVGESGVGKELVARAIHHESQRRNGPFVPVNCAGIPESLLESEFFGHESGAFTGATKKRAGLFGQAIGGTILLDEVGELPLGLQAKLLRVLQEREVRPVGSDKARAIDVRVLVATNRDLENDVLEGRFRKDLFYRLSTFHIAVPALRHRKDDIELLAAHFLVKSSLSAGKRIDGFSDDALRYIKAYNFPGNVRELQNIIERAVTFCNTSAISVSDLPERITTKKTIRRPSQNSSQSGHSSHLIENTLLGDEDMLLTLEEIKEKYIRYVLDYSNGNKRRAAALLGIGRRTLYRYLDDNE